MNEDIKHKILVEFYDKFKNFKNLKPSIFENKTIDEWQNFLVTNHEVIFSENILNAFLYKSQTAKFSVEFNIYHAFLENYLKQNHNLAEIDHISNRLFFTELINRLDKIAYFKSYDSKTKEVNSEILATWTKKFWEEANWIDNQNLPLDDKMELLEPFVRKMHTNKNLMYGDIKTTRIWIELNTHKFIYNLFKIRNGLTHNIIDFKLNMDTLLWTAFFCYTYTLYKLIGDWGKRKWRLTKQERKEPQKEAQDKTNYKINK